MKLGYQDAGSITLMKSIPEDRAKAAWLYGQFIVSKTLEVKKSQVGLTFVRAFIIRDKSFTERAPKLGGLIEFYRSPARMQLTPTGTMVPDDPKLAQLWWQNIGDTSSEAKSVQEAMDSLRAEQEKVISGIEASGVQGYIGPKMANEHDLAWWNAGSCKNGSLAQQLILANENEEGQTIAYEDMIKS